MKISVNELISILLLYFLFNSSLSAAVSIGPVSRLDDFANAHLVDFPIHSSHGKFFVQADELLNTKNIIQRHPTNQIQMEGLPGAGHGGVRNLSNEDLLRFGGPKGDDAIRGFREFQVGDDLRFPGSRINIQGGHHRLEEIAKRVQAGKIKPDTLIELLIQTP